ANPPAKEGDEAPAPTGDDDSTADRSGEQGTGGEGDKPAAAKSDSQQDSEREDGPPKVVLRRTRESLHKTESLLSETEQELEAERTKRAELEQELAGLRAKAGA